MPYASNAVMQCIWLHNQHVAFVETSSSLALNIDCDDVHLCRLEACPVQALDNCRISSTDNDATETINTLAVFGQ